VQQFGYFSQHNPVFTNPNLFLPRHACACGSNQLPFIDSDWSPGKVWSVRIGCSIDWRRGGASNSGEIGCGYGRTADGFTGANLAQSVATTGEQVVAFFDDTAQRGTLQTAQEPSTLPALEVNPVSIAYCLPSQVRDWEIVTVEVC
jgi:hypothetical protein